jgi:Integral membrane protein EMC3/TMCO1-like
VAKRENLDHTNPTTLKHLFTKKLMSSPAAMTNNLNQLCQKSYHYHTSKMPNPKLTLRLPFPVTLRFKSMLQRGIETGDMDVRWVSSISWYFLLLFGLNSVYTLIMKDTRFVGNQLDMMQSQGNPMAQEADVKKV